MSAGDHRRDVRRTADLLRLKLDLPSTPGTSFDEISLSRMVSQPRAVIRDSLRLLVEQGLLERRRGVGSSPIESQYLLDTKLPPRRVPLEDHLGVGALRPRVIHWEPIPAPPMIADRLDEVRPFELVLCVDYVFERDGRPFGLITNYLRYPEASRVQLESFGTDFYTLLDEADADMSTCDFVFQAVAADSDIADSLGIIVGDPVIRFEQVIRNGLGDAIDFAIASHRQEARFQVSDVSRA